MNICSSINNFKIFFLSIYRLSSAVHMIMWPYKDTPARGINHINKTITQWCFTKYLNFPKCTILNFSKCPGIKP